MKKKLKWYEWLIAILFWILILLFTLGIVWLIAYVITNAAKVALGL